MAGIKLQNLIKRFGNTVAVKGINLDVEDGEFLVLVGPSGCGKSTTLRMIAGLEEVSSGEICIGDKIVNNQAPKDRDIAMVFQEYALYPHMNVRRNMAFGLKMRKYPRDEIDKRVQEAAAVLGIRDLLDRKPRELSGGQRQRVALGRAIVRKPLVFLFDEPLSNLDAKLRVQMRAELIKLYNTLKTTIVYVTHDQVEAMTMGTKIVIMKDGEIQQVGPPMEVYQKPVNRFVAGFIGSPSMNFMQAKVVSHDSELVVNTGCLQLPIPDSMKNAYAQYAERDVIFGIRPSDILRPGYMKDFKGKAVVNGIVEVMEPLGSEIILFVKCDEDNFVARVDPGANVRTGQEISLYFDMEKMHLFDFEPPHKRLGLS